VSEIGWHGEEDDAHGQGPHGSDVGKYTKAAWAERAERGPGGLRGKAGEHGLGWARWNEI
jgi:hypothetical protein